MTEQATTAPPVCYLTATEVARVLRVSTMTVYRLVQAGKLPAIRVGRAYRFSLDDFRAHIGDTGEVPRWLSATASGTAR